MGFILNNQCFNQTRHVFCGQSGHQVVQFFDSDRGDRSTSNLRSKVRVREEMSSAELDVPKIEISFDTPNRDRFLRDVFHKKLYLYAILGRGSYGVVIKASYRGRPVAVKILEKRLYRHRPHCDSLLNEANALYIRHDNVVTVLKIVSEAQYGLVLMERFDGHCLQRVLGNQRKHPIALQHKLLILCDIINGLHFCHQRKIVHLDVKPQNVIVTLNPYTCPAQKCNSVATGLRLRTYMCKLCDFGSSMTLAYWQGNETLDNRGTIRYMAPELLRGLQRTRGGVTERADIYSFGVTMWQLHEERFPYQEIACNEVVAYNVVKKGIRPDSVTTIAGGNGRCATNLPRTEDRCQHGSLLFPGSFPGGATVDTRFEIAAVDDVLKRHGISLVYNTRAQGPNNGSIGAMCTEGEECDRELSTTPLSNMFCDHSNIPSHERDQVRQMIRTLYSECWLSDPSSRPDAADVRAAIHQALEKLARYRCAN